jgi:uncharacterized protein
MKTYILYHAQCPDGFGAALAIWQKHKNQYIYLAVSHNQPIPTLELQSEVFLVDFCYPAEVLVGLSQKMHKVMVLDHHKSAEEDLKKLNLADYPNLQVSFDMNKSGAVMAWEYFQQSPVPELFKYIEDKDLWLFKLPKSREFSAGLRAYPMEFELWNKLSVNQLISEGETLLRYQNQIVDKLCKNMRLTQVADYQVPTVNSPILQSEIGNYLCKLYPQYPFSAVYFDGNEKRHFSLRSVGDFDVSAIAKSMGGGGHKNAAGFVVNLQ